LEYSFRDAVFYSLADFSKNFKTFLKNFPCFSKLFSQSTQNGREKYKIEKFCIENTTHPSLGSFHFTLATSSLARESV
jgi:hypothetical protein